MSLADFLAGKLGTRRWVVAARISPQLQATGYTLAIPQNRLAALLKQYEAETGRKPD